MAFDLAARLDAARRRVAALHGVRSGLDAARELSGLIDELLVGHGTNLLAGTPEFAQAPRCLAIVATGGYGRRELNLYSDIDLLFLMADEPTPALEAFVRSFVYPLFNVKIDLGYSLKTIPQVLNEVGHDVDLTTSLVGARCLWGEVGLWRELENKVRLRLTAHFPDLLVPTLLERTAARHRKYSNTVNLLEPNVKESPGALRDLHLVLWLTGLRFGQTGLGVLCDKGLITDREERDLRRAHSFLIELRNALHLLDGRKSDMLNVERQIKIAPMLGYETHEHALPEEQLMRSYYDHAGEVNRIVGRLRKHLATEFNPAGARGSGKRLRRTRIEARFWTREGELWVDPAEAPAVTRDPAWMTHLFATACAHRLQIDDFTLHLVERSSESVDDAVRASPPNRQAIMGIFGDRAHAGKTLRQMHACGYLEAWFPEFKMVRNLPRIDYYHQFTVDEHLLRSVDCAVELTTATGPLERSHAARVAREVLRFDLLSMALLFHDIGKGEGRGHVLRGAHIIQRIADRLELSRRETEILYQLVANHQKMSNLALRRNTEDPRLASDLARDVPEPELLRMLYVLTCCDLRAVSNDSWNDWRGMLLANLYESTMSVLTGRPLGDNRHTPTNEEVAATLANHRPQPSSTGGLESPSRDEILAFLADLPARYRQTTPPSHLERHVRMARGLSDQVLVQLEMEPVEGTNYSELHCVARDSPGLFRHLCGALASRGYNILSAQVFTARDGTCVDVFQLQDHLHNPPTDHGVTDRLRDRLNQVLKGEREPNWKSAQPQQKPISPARLDQRPPTCTISNDPSGEGTTLIEVKAPDRPGLLYDLTSVLDQFRLNIHLALIATESYQVVDVFYVTDLENARLEPGAQTEALRKGLIDVVNATAVEPAPISGTGVPKRKPSDSV